MSESKPSVPAPWIDPDDAPDLSTPEWAAKLDAADVRRGDKIVRRGRPPLDHPKQLVSLRLDQDVLDSLRAGGPDWQSRANAALRAALGLPETV